MAKKLLVKKGKATKLVNESVYENYLKNAGWVVEGEEIKSEPIQNEVPEEIEEEYSDEEWDEDEEVEKPISEMNNEELKEKAISMGIDISSLKSNKQLREAIKAAM